MSTPEDHHGYHESPTVYLAEPSRPEVFTEEAPVAKPPTQWHVGLDLGLLVLRMLLGALFVGHGLRDLFGMLGGDGRQAFADQLQSMGFHQSTLLSWIFSVSELAGGALLFLGMLTPLAAAALLYVTATLVSAKFNVRLFAGGVEPGLVLSVTSFAFLFAGPGRMSVDRPTPWFRYAPAYGFMFLLLATGATTVTAVLLR